MDYLTFKSKFEGAVPVGSLLTNPGGGTSEVLSYASDHVAYKRGNSRIRASLSDFHASFLKFAGSRVTSSDLKSFKPSVYDSSARPAGHPCNCTFLFLGLHRMGFASEIEGSGVRGSPFSVDLRIK